MDRPLAILRRHYALPVLLALAAALRLPWLGAIPTPAGDEGNWPLYALALAHGRPVALPPDARFVSLLFARLIALAFGIAGPSFAAARAVPAAGALAGVALAYALLARPATPAARRAAAAAAAVLAVHPWAVAWSRTAAVPYALALALAAAGPLAARAALARPTPLALVAAAQLLALGLHFSPLALVPLAATALWALADPARRAVLRRPAALAALALAALHAVPLLAGVGVALGAGVLPPPPPGDALGERLAVFARMVVGGLDGESTATHFAGCVSLEAAAGAVLLAVALAVALGCARRGGLAAFGACYLATAVVALPLLLLPGRAWHMPTIDADRYAFVLVAPLALLLGGAAEVAGPRGRWAVAVFVAYLLAVPTARMAAHFLAGGGGDQGLFVARGGGRYRGWQVPRERVALPDLLRAEALRAAAGEPATVAYEDYAFHPIRFAIAAAASNGRGLEHRIARFEFPRGRRVLFVVWADAAFAPGYEPRGVALANCALRERVQRDYDDVRLVRTFTQADGTPLCELWAARAR